MMLLILAKRPEPGRAKTRLAPWVGPEGAAELAAAALADTFAAARASTVDRVVVAFDGDPSGVVPVQFEVIPQRSGTLAERLAGAWDDVGEGGLQIGMDTPQVTGADLDRAFDALDRGPGGSALGPAADGGWWAIGLRRPVDGVFAGIATSRSDTGARQLARLEALGLPPVLLPLQRDVDEPADALAVARDAPHTRFAAAVRHAIDRHGPPHAAPRTALSHGSVAGRQPVAAS